MAPKGVFSAAARKVWLLACAGPAIDAIHSGTGASFGLPHVVWAKWIYVAVFGCCGLAALVAAGSADGARAPRLLLGVGGMLAYALRQVLYTQIVAHQASATFATVADDGWLAFYPCALGAVILIVRGIPDGRDAAAVVLAVAEAPTEVGEAFVVANSHGTATVPGDGEFIGEALARADARMYALEQQRPLRLQANASGCCGASRRGSTLTSKATRPRWRDWLPTPEARSAWIRSGSRSWPTPPSSTTSARSRSRGASSTNRGHSTTRSGRTLRRRTLIGERILGAVPGIEEVATIARSSHERLDGRGYPDGLSGTAFPLEARIISGCDALHAMISNRSYA